MSIIKTAPAVFAAGNTYQIMVIGGMQLTSTDKAH